MPYSRKISPHLNRARYRVLLSYPSRKGTRMRRPEHTDDFRLPYDADELAKGIDFRFTERLGLHLRVAGQLSEEILNDLDETGYGVRWWQGYPKLPTKKRILISDHLVAAAGYVPIYVRQALLHYRETECAWEEMGDTVFRRGRENAGLVPGRQETPEDDLPFALADLHTTDFFRALGSALDCFAAVVIGVLGFPSPIVKASLPAVRQPLALHGQDTKIPAGRPDKILAQSLAGMIAQSGPPGWLDWTIAMRNMLVHRAPRLRLVNFPEVVPALALPNHVNRLQTEALLPRDPRITDVEAFRAAGTWPTALLDEPASLTMLGSLESARALLEGVSEKLLHVWVTRRANPSLIQQPAQQWVQTTPPPATFNGYSPGSAKGLHGILRVPPATAKRLRAASLMDDQLGNWQHF
jgi:hypothetical protein